MKYQLSKYGARLVRLAHVHTKACLGALPHLEHKKCSDPTNFVLHFVKRSFKPPRLSHNPWYRVCDGRFQPRHQTTCCWNFNITLYDAGWIYPQVPSFILNSCTLNAPTPICLADIYLVEKRASRIGGHIKYVTTYRDCSTIPLTLSGGVKQFTWSRVPQENSITSP